jgi:hypothetical protein
VEQIDKLIQSKQSRRRFLAGAGAVGAVGAATLLTGCNDSSSSSNPTPSPTPTPTPQDIPDNDILNFALNLEYLEAEFYLRAATGNGLPASLLLGGDGAVTGGNMVAGVSPPMASYLNATAQDEMNHVAALQATIKGNKGTPVPRPVINFTAAFNALAMAAGIGATFDPFSSPSNFLVGAFIFEDVGVTAYNGAAPAITSNTILDAAAGIAAVEAYHASIIRTLIAGMASATGADQTALTAANAVVKLRATLGGGNETQLSINSIVAADPNTAVGFSRSTSQVLSIVYANSATGTASGGFFPNGLNGSIKTV